MRYKVVPEPRSVEALREARAALPLVPGSVEDCCTRIRDRTDWRSRDEAREVLTLLEALGLAAADGRGFYRTHTSPSDGTLAERYRENVFGVGELLEGLEAEPRTIADAFATVRDCVPSWERDRHTDWESEWTERTRRLLEWARVFGLVERRDEAYRLLDEAD